MSDLKIIIAGDLYSSKNSRRVWRPKGGGRLRVGKSDNAKRQFDEICWELHQQKHIWAAMAGYSDFPLRVEFRIYRSTKRRFDYTNIVQNLLDAMVKMKYLPDDSADYLIPVFAPYEIDKEKPRTEVRILSTSPQ